ncbi:MAG: efflux RND transporter permease subunit, partial [Planctomycetaceae bacterium]|nr:efflux RND transporter permease subunit [Planctomycetaceae bacterium]
LIVLPAHLAHLPDKKLRRADDQKSRRVRSRLWSGLTNFQQHLMDDILLPPYEWFLRLTLRWRYVTVAAAMATFLMAMGLLIGKTKDGYVLGNIVPWEFVQEMDAESMTVTVELPVGSSARSVLERLQVISDAAMQLPEVSTVQIDLAQAMNVEDVGATGGDFQSHLGQIWIELEAADARESARLRSSNEVLAELRKVSDTLSGVNAVTWQIMSGGPGGKDIEIRLSGGNFDDLKSAAKELMHELAQYAGVVDLDENSDEGKREAQLTLRESARPTGITVATLGRQVRAATYGAEARRITRNREDVKIMVRYPEEFRTEIANLESMWIPTDIEGTGGQRQWVPMREVAELTEAIGYTTIHRAAQQRSITVYGDIDEIVTSSSDVVTKVRTEFVPKLIAAHPGIKVEFLGSSEEQAKAFGSLKIAFPVAMLLVYMMLAGLFRNYFQPLVVMAAIPFGIQGAIIGHWWTGNPLTILSFIGLVALTGIVVNDSLVLVDFVNTRIRSGLSQFEASVDGAKLRLRPILLTTFTTVAGIMPLMFEKSFQAKFMIPMAVTLSFGLMFATVLTLILVPSLNLIFFDIEALIAGLIHGPTDEPEPSLAGELVSTSR